ncbi:hypothetical protein BH11VER1_BH11VER1_16690 [soil metagenome]
MSSSRYEVLGQIAEGGLGTVYKAYDRNLRREVALKRVRADSAEEATAQAEQLFAEARTLSTLQHPHIVTIFDVGKDEQGAYIVMELLKGETLEDIIARGALNPFDFRELVTQTLEGMVAAHSTGLIHLDIKPQNFMVIWLPTGKFQIKILDFGLSMFAHVPTVQEMNDDGSILGSIFFMAPEQFERSPVDARTDLYSLGCVFYFALTQSYPFQGDTGPEVMASHLYHSLVPLEQLRPDLPPMVCRWVEWLICRKPEDRPVTVAQAYEWFLAGQAPMPEPPVVPIVSAPVALPVPEAATDPASLPGSTQMIGGGPRVVRPQGPHTGKVSQMLRQSGPRPTRTGPVGPAIGHRTAPKPVARIVNIATAAAPVHLIEKKPLPKALTFWTPIGVGALIVLFFGYKFTTDFMAGRKLQTWANSGAPTSVSGGDVSMLLGFMDDLDNGKIASQVLGKIPDTGSSENLIAGFIRVTQSSLGVKNVALAIAARGVPASATEPLIKQLGKIKESDSRVAVWQALARTGEPTDSGALIGAVSTASDEEVRAAEAALVSVAQKDADANLASQPFLTAFRANSNDEGVKALLLRVLGKIGGSNSMDDLLKNLDNSSPMVRNAAAAAFSNWPNAEPLPALISALPAAKDSLIRTNIVNTIGYLAGQAGEVPQEEIAKSLIDAYGKTTDNREQVIVAQALARVVHPSVIPFFEELAKKDPRRQSITTPGIKYIKDVLAKAVPIGDGTSLPIPQATLSPGPLLITDGIVMNWLGVSDHVSWYVTIEKPGQYEIQLSQSYNGDTPGSYVVAFGKSMLLKKVEKTPSFKDFKSINVGKVQITKPGDYFLWIRPKQILAGDPMMRLKEVTLKRVGN